MGRRVTYAVVMLAVISAVAAYGYFRMPLSMLVLQIRTYEKGPRTVNTTAEEGSTSSLEFEVGNDQGEASFYVIELPRKVLKIIKVEQLGGQGRLEIDAVTLQIEEASYIWSSQDACVRKVMANGGISREPCDIGQPQLAMTADFNLTISDIPAPKSGAYEARGLIAAVAGFSAVLLSGFWLCRPIRGAVCHAGAEEYLARGFWLTLVAVYLLQFMAVWQYSVDVPFWEEWEYFLPDGLQEGLSWDWLFSFAGYHRVVPTKIMAWLNLELFGLDFKLQKLCNYLLYGGLLLTMVSLKKRLVGRNEFVLFPAFLLFLVSPIMYENHSNSYQSQIHIVIICALMALFHIYSDSLKTASQAIFLFALMAAINTFSGGMTIALVLLPCWALFVLAQTANGNNAKWKSVLLLLLGGGAVGAVAAAWIDGYQQPTDCVWISPFSGLFWETFLNLLSFGFGFETEHPLPGIFCLLLVVTPLFLLWKNRELRRQKEVWQVTTGVLVFLAILATISITRGNFIGTSKASRYVEFSLMLIPLTSIAWWLALRKTWQRYCALALLWAACFAAFSNDWSYSPYRDGGQMDRFVLDTLEDYVRGRGDGTFTWSHPKPLPPFFEGARQLDVKFTRQFKGLAKEPGQTINLQNAGGVPP